MSECWLYYNNRDYLAKNLTSHARVILNFKRYAMKGIWCAWQKEFSFGGDKLIIEQEFFVKRKQSFFKYNPIYNKIQRGFKFDEYKELYGKDKKWNEYCKYVAKETNSENELNKVFEDAQKVVDLLNKWSDEGKL